MINSLNSMNEQKKLRPVIYTTSSFSKFSPDETKQMVLLKALQVTSNPTKLKQMIGVRTVAEVYRTLDKLSMRREYHEALLRAGITLDFVTKELMDLATNSNDKVRLGALNTILKSIGLEKYETAEAGSTGTWEEELLKSMSNKPEPPLLSAPAGEGGEYEVIVPETPPEMKKLRADEEELIKGIYE